MKGWPEPLVAPVLSDDGEVDAPNAGDGVEVGADVDVGDTVAVEDGSVDAVDVEAVDGGLARYGLTGITPSVEYGCGASRIAVLVVMTQG